MLVTVAYRGVWAFTDGAGQNTCRSEHARSYITSVASITPFLLGPAACAQRVPPGAAVQSAGFRS